MGDFEISAPGAFPILPEREYRVLVLLVDDQPIVGEAIRRLLADEQDISLHYCADAASAVTLAEQRR